MTTWVYFLQPEGGGPIKIGCSRLPESRLSTLTSWSPTPLRLVAKMVGDRGTEAHLHAIFAEHRTHSEWFSPAPALLWMVRTIAETGTFPGAISMPPVPAGYRRVNRIAEARRDVFRMSIEDFATACGVVVPSVRNWERCYLGEIAVVRVVLAARRLALALRPADLCGLISKEEYDAQEKAARANETPWRPARRASQDGLTAILEAIGQHCAAPRSHHRCAPLNADAHCAVAVRLNELLADTAPGINDLAGAFSAVSRHAFNRMLARLETWQPVERVGGGRPSLRFLAQYEDRPPKPAQVAA